MGFINKQIKIKPEIYNNLESTKAEYNRNRGQANSNQQAQ
jgi:hypothetical protein